MPKNRWRTEQSGNWLILEQRSRGVGQVKRLDRLAPHEAAGVGRIKRIIHRPDSPMSHRSECGAGGQRRHRDRIDMSAAERCSECFDEAARADGGAVAQRRATPAGIGAHFQFADGKLELSPAAAGLGAVALFGLGLLLASGGGR